MKKNKISLAAVAMFAAASLAVVTPASAFAFDETVVSDEPSVDDPEENGNGEERPEPPDGFGKGEKPPTGENGERLGLPEGFDDERPAPPNGEKPPEKPDGDGGFGPQGGFEEKNDGNVPERNSATTLTEGIDGGKFESSADGESAVLASDGEASISNSSVSKTGDSDGDESDFYGTNAAVLVENGATLKVSGTDVETDGTHANGIFSYGEGTTVEISDSTITTKGDCSGALMTTGGGTTIADGVSLETFGRSSAPIRSDRGGGTVVVSGSTAISHGIGSPAIYSTADVSVSNSSLEATDSEAVVIEGGNSVSLEDVELVGNDADLNGQALVPTSVLII